MLQVAVGIIRNKFGDVLISQRANHVHQGGVWEFPGGKVESHENSYQALQRELKEELNISVIAAKPLIKIRHQYTDIVVCLNVHAVDSYEGLAKGMEKQAIRWVAPSSLNDFIFPDANKAILELLNLPEFYPIVDDCLGSEAKILAHLENLIKQGHTMIQLRAKSLSGEEFKELAKQALKQCRNTRVKLFLNTSLDVAKELGACAVHLNSRELALKSDKECNGLLFAASCHSVEELKKAHESGVIFAVLSPVCATESHKLVEPIGWNSFGLLANESSIPVFALGGVGPEDLGLVKRHNGHGISGIRGFL